MRAAKWVLSGIIIASLIFVGLQGLWLRGMVSEQSEILTKLQQGQDELNESLKDIATNLSNVIPDTRQMLMDVLGNRKSELAERLPVTLCPPLMILRFDDCCKSDWNIARPLLNSYQFNGTFAIPASFVGQDNRTTLAELITLQNEGHEISYHGWTHAYDASTQRLTTDVSAGTTTLTLDTLSELGMYVSDAFPTKTKLSDDVNPDGEYIEIVAMNYETGEISLKAGIESNYTVANNAKLRMDNKCIAFAFGEARDWFSHQNGLFHPLTVCVWGGDPSHQQHWWKYITRDYIAYSSVLGSAWASNWNDYKGVSDSILRYTGTGSLACYNIGSEDTQLVKGIVSSRAKPGLITTLLFHELYESNPGKASDKAEFESILALIKSLDYQVVTLSQAAALVKQYSAKDAVLCLFEDSILSRSTVSGLPINIVEFRHADLSVEISYHADAKAGGKLHIYTSADGRNYDTEPTETRTLSFAAGVTKRETFTPNDAAQRARYLIVTVENMDTSQVMTNAKVIATLMR